MATVTTHQNEQIIVTKYPSITDNSEINIQNTSMQLQAQDGTNTCSITVNSDGTVTITSTNGTNTNSIILTPTSINLPMSFSLPAELLKVKLKNGASTNLAVDGSITSQDFSYTVPAGQELFVQRFTAFLIDPVNFTWDSFGGLPALANGVEVLFAGVSVLPDFIKTNADFNELCYDVEARRYLANVRQHFALRWTVTREVGSPIKLVAGESVTWRVRDDLTGLLNFEVAVGGKLVTV